MFFACWITKATDTHSEYEISLVFQDVGYANAPKCYVICTLPVIFNINKINNRLHAFKFERVKW